MYFVSRLPILLVLVALSIAIACSSDEDSGSSAVQPTQGNAPAEPSASFGDGIYIVGRDIEPGIYRNSDSSRLCYWERLSGFGGDIDEIVTNRSSEVLQVVEIADSDAGFSSRDCGIWSLGSAAITSKPTDSFGDGFYLVGTDVAAGTWRNSDSSDLCYWERLSGFGGQTEEVISSELSISLQIVEIATSDTGFSSDHCGIWTKTD